MSDNNLNEEVTVVVEDAQVITTPIDATLTISGDAADAKAVGDALALKADASSVTAISVNGETADNQGTILINGTEIPMSGTDETTLKAAIDTVGAKTGADIALNGDENAVTIEQAIQNAAAESASVTQNVLQLGGSITDNSYALEGLAIGTKTLPVIDPNAVRSVNNTLPGSGGNVQITTVDVARQLQTDNAQVIEGTFIERPTGGDTNVGDGPAWLSVVRGNSTHTGIVEESFTVTVTSSEQEPITAEVTTPATFRTQAETGGTYTFTFTTAWDVDPATWGVTVTGTPVSGDVVSVVWVEADRGTITPSYPSAFNATNWNLYNHTVGYARVLKYSDEYNFKISGAYTSISFATTTGGTPLVLTPVNGVFSIPSDGYVFVEGGNNTTTAIWMQWSNWTENYDGSFKAHNEETIDLSTVMSTYFSNGLCAVGSVADEININIGQAIQRIERMAYTAENLAAVIAAGRAYDADENYIYAVLENEVTNDISVDGAYTAFDHGMEYFDTTSVGAYAQILYGENLVDKLRTDVVQISAQTLTSGQQAQVRTNIGAAGAEGLALIGTIKSFSLSSSQKLLTVADNNDICPIGISIINLASGDDSDLPSSSYKYGKAIVEKYATHRIVVTIRSILDNTKVAVNRMDSSNAWLGWRTLVDSNDVYNGLDKTSAGFVLDARQGKKLMARSTVNTLVVRSSGTATGTSASISTYGERKFSDYWMLGFLMYSSTSDSIIRDVKWIDASHWTSGAVIQTIANHGASLGSVSGIQFSYNSDTSVSVITIGAGSLTNFEIIGLLNQ